MNPATVLRRLFVLFAVLLIALVLGTWLVISLAAQLSAHSERQTAATEFALTLTRLANLVVVPGELESEVGGVKGDSLAQLLAMGDVQSKALATNPSQGWFKSAGSKELSTDANEISARWLTIKSALAELNANALTVDGEAVGRLLNPELLDAVDQAFDAVFTGVTNETLSVPLLQILSEVKAELASLQFLNSLPANDLFIQPFNNSFERFATAVDTLQVRVRGEQGGSLIGYESSLAMQRFLEKTALLKPATTAVQLDTKEPKPLDLTGAQSLIQNAISRNEIARRALDNAIYQYRRAILGALACLCAAILLSAIVAWRIWSLKKQSRRLHDDDLGDMVAQISAIADGDLAVTVQPLTGDSLHAQQSRSIADAVNHTEKMFRSLVHVSRSVAIRTFELTDRQQQITRSLIDSQSLPSQPLLEQIDSLQQHAEELKALSGSEVPAYDDVATYAEKARSSAVTSNASLAGISSQVELGSSRISRAAETVGELSLVVEKIKATAEKASLKALNTSIQISAYGDGGDLEISPQFLDDVLAVSRNLIASATDAQRLADGLKSDLQATSVAMTSCSAAIDDGADGSLKAGHVTGALVSGLEALSADRQRLIEALVSSSSNLNIAAEILTTHDDNIGIAEQYKELLQTALETQELAGNFEKSLSRYRLNRDEAVGG